MKWFQLRFTLTDADWLRLEENSEPAGVVSISYRSLAPEEPQRLEVCLLYEAAIDPEAARRWVVDYLPSVTDVQIEYLEDRDWTRAWMDHFQPMRFGRRLWVVPSFAEPPDPEAVNIVLDPGRAFGSGTHETTALCLEWLEQQKLDRQQLLDYGCGSGILTIAAVLLGLPRAWGCDIDPVAIEVSRDNARRNGVADQVWLGRPQDLHERRFDIIIANILSEVLIGSSLELASLQPPGGQIVLSGILHQQEDSVREAYAACYDFEESMEKEPWILMRGRRK